MPSPSLELRSLRGTITLGDKTVRFRPITLGQARKYADALAAIADSKRIAASGAQAMQFMGALLPLIQECAIVPGDQSQSNDFVEQYVTVANFHLVFKALMDACWPEGVDAAGEEAPAAMRQ